MSTHVPTLCPPDPTNSHSSPALPQEFWGNTDFLASSLGEGSTACFCLPAAGEIGRLSRRWWGQGRRRPTAEPEWMSQHRPKIFIQIAWQHYDPVLVFDLYTIIFLHRLVMANENIETLFHRVSWCLWNPVLALSTAMLSRWGAAPHLNGHALITKWGIWWRNPMQWNQLAETAKIPQAMQELLIDRTLSSLGSSQSSRKLYNFLGRGREKLHGFEDRRKPSQKW